MPEMNIETVGDLKEVLEDYEDDARLRVAFQPGWPLRGYVASVTSSQEIRSEEPDEEEDPADPTDEGVVWIAVNQMSGGSGDESPYAPSGAWLG